MLVGADGGIESGGADALVFGDQVVGELVKVGDPADHRRAGDDVVDARGKVGQEGGVLGVAFDQPVVRMAVVRAPHRPVLAEVVDAYDLVAGLEQLGDEVAADESARAGDENLQSRMGPVIPQMSTTSRPFSSSWR